MRCMGLVSLLVSDLRQLLLITSSDRTRSFFYPSYVYQVKVLPIRFASLPNLPARMGINMMSDQAFFTLTTLITISAKAKSNDPLLRLANIYLEAAHPHQYYPTTTPSTHPPTSVTISESHRSQSSASLTPAPSLATYPASKNSSISKRRSLTEHEASRYAIHTGRARRLRDKARGCARTCHVKSAIPGRHDNTSCTRGLPP
jgi:hypothetical protein